MGFVFALLLFLFIASLIGHLIWVTIAWLCRSIAGPVGRPAGPTNCLRCGDEWEPGPGSRACRLCGWAPNVGMEIARPRPDLALDQLRRRVERYGQIGLLPAAIRDRLVRAIQAEESALTSLVKQPEAPAPARPSMAERIGPIAPAPARGSRPPEPVAAALDRVRSFREAQQAAGVNPARAEAVVPPPPPRRFIDLLSAFLEEKSIRWGELVGGLLIVGCSLALVISFWSSIAQRPLIKYVLLNGVTALLFALGMHAQRRWKLPTTALGLLTIATLLTPLNFLAVASLVEVEGASTPPGWSLAGEMMAVALFAFLLLRAGRSLVAGVPWALLVAVVVPSASMLLLGRSVAPGRMEAMAVVLAGLPWLAAGVAIGGWVVRFRKEAEIREGLAVELLRLLGLGAFAATVALGLVIVHAGPVPGLARLLSPLAPLIGGTILVPGLLLWRRVVAPELVGYRTTGTAIAAAGTLILLAGMALAWPTPARMLPVALLDAAVLAAIAVAFRVPAAHAIAGLCLSLAYLLGWAAATGRLDWHDASSARLTEVLLSAGVGAVLVPVALVFGVLGAALARARQRFDAQAYALVAALAGLASIGLVTWHGFGIAGDPARATWVYAVFALAAPLFGCWFAWHPLVEGTGGRAETRGLAWLGSGLLLAALVQGLAYGGVPLAPRLPWIVALLVHSTVTTGAGLALMRWTARRRHGLGPGADEFAPVNPGGLPGGAVLADVLDRSALMATIGAACGLVISVSFAASGSLAAYGLWLALIWLILAAKTGSPGTFAAGQGALTWAVAFGVATALGGQDWYARSPLAWLDPRMIQAQGLALGLVCLGWIGVRLGVRRRPKSAPVLGVLLDPPWPTWDRCARWVVVAFMLGLAVYAAVPGVAQELTPRDVAARLAGTSAAGRVVPPAAVFEFPGIPHAPALGGGSWALWGLTIGLLLAGQWERFRKLDLLATLAVVTLVALLVAALGEPSVAAGSALRWSGAVVLLATSALIWDRARLGRWARRVGWRPDPEGERTLPGLATALVLGLAGLPLLVMGVYVAAAAVVGRPLGERLGEIWAAVAVLFLVLGAASVAVRGSRSWVRPLLAVLGAGPLMAVTTFVVLTALRGNAMVGPEPGTFFRQIGQAGSFVPPILLVAATLVGFAVRERSSGFAFAAGLAWNVTATVGFLTLAARSGLSLDSSLVVRLAQLNALVTAVTALAWIGALAFERRRHESAGPVPADDPLLMTSVALGVALNLLVLLAGTAALFFDPYPRAAHLLIAGPLGTLALATVAGAVYAWTRSSGKAVGPDWRGFGLLCLADFLALGLTQRDLGNWFAYHGVLIGQAMAGAALPILAWRAAGARPEGVTDEVRAAVGRWSTLALVAVVLFAIRGYWSDPQSPWWTVGGLALMSGLAASLAIWTTRPGYLRLAGVLGNLAATFWWFASPRSAPNWTAVADLVNINVVALALPVPAWLWVERRLPRASRWWLAPFHRSVAWLALVLLALIVGVCLGDDASRGTGQPLAWVGWAAVGAVALALGAGLREPGVAVPVAGLYLLGLVAAGWTVAQFNLPPRWLAWTGTMVLAAYSVGTSYLWSQRAAIRGVADRLGIPRPEADDPAANLAWLVPANLGLAAAVAILAFGTILTDPEIGLRSASAHAVVAEILAVGLLARGARRTRLQAIALAVGVVGAVAWGWAWIAPGSATGFLDRSAIILAAAVAGAALYGLGLSKLPRLEDDWTRAARRVVPDLLWLAGAILVVILLAEVSERVQGTRRSPISISAAGVALVALTLVGAAGAALVAAVVPGRDPLGLSERGRTSYVYGSEVLGVLLGAHIKLTLPWLFSGFFIQYWPFLLMAVAFVGVGLSEIFRRQGRMVLAEPLERTGALLPLFPLLAALRTAPRPGEDVVYLAIVGCLYTTLALSRSSVAFGALAALAGNGAFWAWLSYQANLSLFAHPQLWVIPPAFCVLVGGFLNRDRLTRDQLAAISYGASMAIYLASTADIILTGVARAPWLPAVLAALSVGGIFTGILLRVRGFLFLGLGFLSLAIFSIIWYAAVDLHQTWLWAASGVVAGVLILVMFGLFEKKRHEVIRVVGQLKEWNP